MYMYFNICICIIHIYIYIYIYIYIGGKQFNVEEQWFRGMLTEIGQPFPEQVLHFDKKGKPVCVAKCCYSVATVLLQCCKGPPLRQEGQAGTKKWKCVADVLLKCF